MKVSLSVLGAAKTDSGYNTLCKSFCSATIGTCTKWTVNEPSREQFPIWGHQKFNFPDFKFYSLVQSKKSTGINTSPPVISFTRF